jgi:N utilization substance protein B
MLNRRNLRIKVMQSLFAFEQNRDANYQLAIDQVSEIFSPDLNAMVQPDKKDLSKKREQAVALLKNVFPDEASLPEGDDEIVKAVRNALSFYHRSVQKDFEWFRTNLVSETERLSHHYLTVLSLAPALADAAAVDRKFKHTNFVQNPWVGALRLHPEVQRAGQMAWSSRQDVVRQWLRDVLKADEEYLRFLDIRAPEEEDYRKAILHLFRRLILGKTLISEFFESEILRWAEDREIVKGMVEKTIKSWSPVKNQPLQLHTLSLNWEEDREFMEELFKQSAFLPEQHRQRIARNSRNWALERLPLTDRIILEMAIAEMLTFPSIPVKVTINEYIELAKNYSTPKSKQFINGILDVLSKELKTEGLLKKSGRGLIDNK